MNWIGLILAVVCTVSAIYEHNTYALLGWLTTVVLWARIIKYEEEA